MRAALVALTLLVAVSAISPLWTRGERADPAHRVQLTIAVKQKNMDTLRSIVDDISNPLSANFNQLLSFEKIVSMTANPEAAQAVAAWLAASAPSAQIFITKTTDYVRVEVSAAEAEQLLSTTFHMYRHYPADGSAVRTTVRAEAYTLPSHIAPHVDFVTAAGSMPNVHPRHPARPVDKETAAKLSQSNANAIPPIVAGYVTPALLWQVYSIASPTVVSTQSTQSLFESLLQSYSPSDLTMFQQSFNLQVNPITTLIGPNNASDCVPEPNNCGEANLDVQIIMGISQGSPTTFWSIDANDQTPFIDWVVAVSNDASAPYVHSVSYGDVEIYDDPNMQQRFNDDVQKLAARGITVIVASGDDGVANFPARGNASACGFFPSFPASASYVTAVGATQGLESSQPEVACTSATGGGITTGGGFSGVFSQPAYQSAAVQAYLNNANANIPPTNMFASQGRGYPDVAVAGHAYILVIGGNFTAADGTSASAPMFAGMITLINAERIQAGKNPLGFLNQIIYNLGATNPSVFNDITSGENNCAAGAPQGQQGAATCCQYGFTATSGWDAASGWGSVNFPKFSAALLALP